MQWLVDWILNAVSLLLVSYLVPGFQISSFGTALLAAVVVSVVNSLLFWIVALVTLPLTILTLGFFVFVINAILLKIASALVPGFNLVGFVPALIGGIVLAVVHMMLRLAF